MKKAISFLLIALAIAGGYFFAKSKEVKLADTKITPSAVVGPEYVFYKNSEYSPAFMYPKQWGAVLIKEGIQVCPEEDTYRTPDTLSVFDWEFSFAEMLLKASESRVRIGVRFYELDPTRLNSCGGEFLLKIARKEIDPHAISSFMLRSITNRAGLSGIYNPEASRLTTESRRQYTFFVPRVSGFFVLQPYISFAPYFDSPELKELEEQFDGDMYQYLQVGKTSEVLRNYFKEFAVLAESLQFSGE